MDGPNGIAPNDIITVHGSGGEARLDGDMIGNTARILEQAYKACYGELVEWVSSPDGRRSFEIQENGSLWTTGGHRGKPIEIFSRVSTSHVRRHIEEAQALAELNGTADADSKKVITQEDLDELNDTLEFELTYEGAKWFANQKHWGWIAHRKFENTVIQLRRADIEGE